MVLFLPGRGQSTYRTHMLIYIYIYHYQYGTRYITNSVQHMTNAAAVHITWRITVHRLHVLVEILLVEVGCMAKTTLKLLDTGTFLVGRIFLTAPLMRQDGPKMGQLLAAKLTGCPLRSVICHMLLEVISSVKPLLA